MTFRPTFHASIAAAMIATGTAVTRTSLHAQALLSAYADRDGYVDVQKLTCAQLANTWQEDADLLAAWYSGWCNGLPKAHRVKIPRITDDEHLVSYCKENPHLKIIGAINLVFKSGKR